MNRDPPDFLPEPIRDALRRKSSRDPGSRFCSKLHLLLTYTSECPEHLDLVGAQWVTEDEFRMNKLVLAGVMGIKPNTLNVNLHDLRFEQQQRDKDGWTRWKRTGFSRCSNAVDDHFHHQVIPERPPGEPRLVGSSPSVPFTLGHISDQLIDRFFTESQRIWTDVFQCSPTSSVPLESAIDRTADWFRYQEQPRDNAHDVIEAIMKPTATEPRLSFSDFCRFLAMFGPARTVMLKISALLTCSNSTGKWLIFEKDRSSVKLPVAFFNHEMPNCLIVCHADNSREKVFNNPVVETGKDEYLIDEFGHLYKDWDVWFRVHPVKHPVYGMYPVR